MDEIYVCMNVFVMMECKKKIVVLGHFAECCTRQRTPLPSAMVTTLGKAGKMGDQKTYFPTLPSAVTITLGKEILKKKFKLCRVPTVLALGKDFFLKKIFAECLEWWHSAKKISKKNKSSLPSAFRVDARQIIFFKKIKNLCRVPGGLALGKENFQKK